jgi:hypothetical protein
MVEVDVVGGDVGQIIGAEVELSGHDVGCGSSSGPSAPAADIGLLGGASGRGYS